MVVLLVLAVQEPAVGVVCLIHQLLVWPVRVSVAELWATELAVSVAAVVVKDVLLVVVVCRWSLSRRCRCKRLRG